MRGSCKILNKILNSLFFKLCRCYIVEHGWTCQLRESSEFEDIAALNQFIRDHRVLAALGIHALRAGQLLRGSLASFTMLPFIFPL